jgi:Flp pilus assembly protein TadG
MKKIIKQKVKSSEAGQSTVEFALIIPVVAIFLMLILQVGLVVRQKILVTNSSREAARILSVENDFGKATMKAKETVNDAKVIISRPANQGEYLTVTIKDVVKSKIPILGVIFPDISVTSKTTMRVEK